MNSALGAKIYPALNSVASREQAQYKWLGTYSGCILGIYSQAKIGRAIDCDMHGVMTLTARCSASLVAKTPTLANTKKPTLANTNTNMQVEAHTYNADILQFDKIQPRVNCGDVKAFQA